MWPFKKADTRPRILVVDAWRDGGRVEFAEKRVSKIGQYFTFKKYDFSDDVMVLLPGGMVRGADRMTWEKIDDIPGLTDAASSNRPEA